MTQQTGNLSDTERAVSALIGLVARQNDAFTWVSFGQAVIAQRSHA
jgi:hypothetical protein